MNQRISFRERCGDNYIKVVTTTDPETIPLLFAARISQRSEQYICDEIARGNLNWGYAYDYGVRINPVGIFDENLTGQKVIILDHKWYAWIKRKQALNTAKTSK